MRTETHIGKVICTPENTVEVELVDNKGGKDYDNWEFQQRVFAREDFEGVVDLERQSYVELRVMRKPGTIVFKIRDVTDEVDPVDYELPDSYLFPGLENSEFFNKIDSVIPPSEVQHSRSESFEDNRWK